jgi:hypothetical protein
MIVTYTAHIAFAHGLVYVFTDLSVDEVQDIKDWKKGLREQVLEFDWKGELYLFDRDFACAISIVEDGRYEDIPSC